MAEYIERQAIMDALLHEQYGYLCEDAIKHIPAADVAPVRHGRNLKENLSSLFECSLCHWVCNDTYFGGEYFYCPGCGAKLDGGEE